MKKRKNTILKAILIIFTIYTAVNMFSLATQIKAKKEELETIQQEVYKQQITNQELEEAAQTELTEDEIADIARSKLGYALPGERVFIDITGK